MIKKSLFAITLISMVLLTQCLEAVNSSIRVRGSGKVITVKPDVTGFDKVQVSNAFDVRITQAKEYDITLNIDENIKPYLVVEKRGNSLHIFLEGRISYDDLELNINISMPDIQRLGLSGACDAEITGFNFDHKMEIHLSGASEVDGSIKTGDLELHLSGASEVELEGSGKNLNIHASGASDLELEDFPVEVADLHLSGATDARINVKELLNGSVSGASEIRYRGRPRLGDLSSSGASEIKSIN